jgi:hypothetical protein
MLVDALDWYDRARALEPASGDAIVAQGFVHLLAGRADHAIALFHEVRMRTCVCACECMPVGAWR